MGPDISKPLSSKRAYNQAILVKSIIRQRRLLTLLVVILCLLAFTQSAFAQTSQLTGIITDSNSAVIAGAHITLSNLDTAVARKAVTNMAGYYSIPFVPPGPYRLHVYSSGFKPVTHEGIRINVDQPVRIDFTLEIGALTESVNISGNGPLLERETSSIGQVIENKTIVTLPLNGRNYSQLVLLMPGATPNRLTQAADGFSLNGNRTTQNKFLVDGLDNNNYLLGLTTGCCFDPAALTYSVQEERGSSWSPGCQSTHVTRDGQPGRLPIALNSPIVPWVHRSRVEHWLLD